MWNNNYLSLINFKVKLHRQRLFFIKEHDVGSSINFNLVNMVSRGLLELRTLTTPMSSEKKSQYYCNMRSRQLPNKGSKHMPKNLHYLSFNLLEMT